MFVKKKIVLDDVVIGNVLKENISCPATRVPVEFGVVDVGDYVLFGVKNKGLKK